MNKPSDDSKLFLRRKVAAQREMVYKAWTDPQDIKQWFAPGPLETPEASVDLRIGGKFRIVMRNPADNTTHIASGVYREINPPERLVFTWSWEGDPDSGDMLVTIELHATGQETEILLTHEFLPSRESKEQHTKGWIGCLDKLETALQPK